VEIALFVIASFAPGLFWLWFYLRVNRIHPSPKKLVALTFFLGMLSTVPAGIINTLALPEDLLNGASLTTVAAAMLVVVGPVEETSKFLAVRLGPYRSRHFREPVDGLVYSTAASLGFASLENLLYVFMFGPAVMLVRAPLSTVAHLTFGSLWGYGLGEHERSGRRRSAFVLVTLLAAALLHAAFNIAAFSVSFAWVSAVIVALGGAWAYRRFQWGQRVSPYRHRRNYPLIACANCGNDVRIISTFCPHCGVRLDREADTLIFGNCRQSNSADALYCMRCGDRFIEE
jgi:RsiW-degrading membrane proteinase PrsW (M82 family)